MHDVQRFKKRDTVWCVKFQIWNAGVQVSCLFQCSLITLQSFQVNLHGVLFLSFSTGRDGSFLGRVRRLIFWRCKNFDPNLVMLAQKWVKNQEFNKIPGNNSVSWSPGPQERLVSFLLFQSYEIQWLHFGGPGNHETIQAYLYFLPHYLKFSFYFACCRFYHFAAASDACSGPHQGAHQRSFTNTGQRRHRWNSHGGHGARSMDKQSDKNRQVCDSMWHN